MNPNDRAEKNDISGYNYPEIMIPSFLLSLREGFEAALILGIVFGALHKVNRRDLNPVVWSGAAAAALVSVLAAIFLHGLGAKFEGRAEEIFEGVMMLVAAMLLTWMIFWMRRQAGAFSGELEGSIVSGTALGSGKALFLVAFLAVVREGLELAFFLTISAFSSSALLIILGAIAGLSVAALLGVLLFTTTRHLSVKSFFSITNILLILFAAGLVARSAHEFNEAGLVPPIIEHVWDINHILNEESTIGSVFVSLLGYNGNPSLSEVFAYFSYIVFVWLLFYITALPVRGRNQKIDPMETS